MNDSGYNTDIVGINRDYADTMTGMNARKYATESQYGFGAEHAQNPYTRANLLSSAYERAFNQTGNTYAARGQLFHSGALDRGRAYDANAYQQGTYDLRGEYDRELMNLEAERMAAERGLASGSEKAYAEMLRREMEKEPDTTLNPGGEAEKAAGGGGKKGGKKDGGKKKPGLVATTRARTGAACPQMPPVNTSAPRPPSAAANEPSSRPIR